MVVGRGGRGTRRRWRQMVWPQRREMCVWRPIGVRAGGAVSRRRFTAC